MTISTTEAREALRDIDASADLARAFQGYRIAAPYFFIWGVIWIVGYGATGLSPSNYVVWPPLTVVGMALSVYVGWRNRAQKGRDARFGMRMWATFLAFALFVAGTYAILQPHIPNQFSAYPALVTGMAYALAGLWSNRLRLTVVGAAIAAAAMIGFFYLGDYLAFWLAAFGGGGLILTGFWLRSA